MEHHLLIDRSFLGASMGARRVSLRNGFTLIEVVIAMAVLGVLVAIAIPSFKSWLGGAQIRTAAEGVQNGLQLARQMALAQNAQFQFQFNTPSTNDWSISAVATPTVAVQSRINAGSTPQASIATSLTGTAPTVVFNGLGRVVGATSMSTFTISNPTAGACQSASGPMRCLKVTVQVGGQIRMCDPQLPSTDPQSC